MGKAENDYRQLLEQCESQAAADFDKTAVTLAGGALGISLAFLKDIAPNPPTWSVYYLLVPAWFFPVLALLCIFLSLMTSMESMRYELSCLNGRQRVSEHEPAGGRWRTLTYLFNYLALSSCILGIAFFATFATINMGSSQVMPTKQPEQKPASAVESIRGRITPDPPPSGPTTAGRITPDRPTTPSPATSVPVNKK